MYLYHKISKPQKDSIIIEIKMKGIGKSRCDKKIDFMCMISVREIFNVYAFKKKKT